MNDSSTTTIQGLGDRADRADVFSSVTVSDDGGRLVCAARGPESDAEYRIERTDAGWTIGLVTPDRWLSESIEAELVHTGDSMEELLEEELIDLGIDPDPIRIEHFRSEDLLYTFQTTVPDVTPEDTVATWLLAFEATFRVLGDMSGEDED